MPGRRCVQPLAPANSLARSVEVGVNRAAEIVGADEQAIEQQSGVDGTDFDAGLGAEFTRCGSNRVMAQHAAIAVALDFSRCARAGGLRHHQADLSRRSGGDAAGRVGAEDTVGDGSR